MTLPAPARIRHIDGKHQAVCDKCHWKGPDLFDVETSKNILQRHIETRQHKVNARAAHRFTA